MLFINFGLVCVIFLNHILMNEFVKMEPETEYELCLIFGLYYSLF